MIVAVMVWDGGSDTGGDMLLKTLYSVASIGDLDCTQHVCTSGKWSIAEWVFSFLKYGVNVGVALAISSFIFCITLFSFIIKR